MQKINHITLAAVERNTKAYVNYRLVGASALTARELHRMKSNELTLPQHRIADRRRPNITQQTEPLFPVVVPITLTLMYLTNAFLRVGCPICLIPLILRTLLSLSYPHARLLNKKQPLLCFALCSSREHIALAALLTMLVI